MAEPPLCSIADLDRLDIDQAADLCEVLDIKRAAAEQAHQRAKRERDKRGR